MSHVRSSNGSSSRCSGCPVDALREVRDQHVEMASEFAQWAEETLQVLTHVVKKLDKIIENTQTDQKDRS